MDNSEMKEKLRAVFPANKVVTDKKTTEDENGSTLQNGDVKRPKLELPEIELAQAEETMNEKLHEVDPELYAEWLEIVSGQKNLHTQNKFLELYDRIKTKIKDSFEDIKEDVEEWNLERKSENREIFVPRGENRENEFPEEVSERDNFVEQLKHRVETEYKELPKTKASRSIGGPIER